MAAVHEGTRWIDIVQSALDEVVPEGDEVVFNVFAEASIDTDPEAVNEVCRGCGEEHPGLVHFVIVTIAVIGPPENPTMSFRVSQIMDIAEADEPDELRKVALSIWHDLAFQRQAATMPDIDIEHTG